MKKIMIVIVSILGAGCFFYLYYSGSWKVLAEKAGITKSVKIAETVPSGRRQGDGTSAEQKAEGASQAVEEAPTVDIPMDKQQMIGVKTTKAAVKFLQKTIRTVGRIEYDERKLATANTKVDVW
ncbi:MAG: efflux RND transporter periplasmic adaptor subunit [Syntrophales bacterium LBB04]|nr:efflux RND transporter periplasmic adaptor subunit [Syntrophales bacterium LBB04]